MAKKVVRKKGNPWTEVAPLKKNSLIERKNIDGSIAVLALDNDQYFFTIDKLAAETWEKVDGHKTWAEIGNLVAKKHQMAFSDIEADLGAFAKELSSLELLDR